MLIYLLSYLMISTHRYASFKHLDIPREKRFQLFIGLILLFILLASEPPKTLFPAIFLYTLSGPVLALRGRLGRKKVKAVSPDNRPL